MATSLHSEGRRRYSWWWDSHISPKNSKWLQDNLTDMDTKVKAMIKLIEEDADSFARRAEMYYKKRPELMKLVEEFYRAYRALAERYNHATVELRHAHRAMAEAFPNQVPFVLADDSPSGSSGNEVEPHTPEMPHPLRAVFDLDDSEDTNLGMSNKGVKQLHEMCTPGVQPQKSNCEKGMMKKGLNVGEAEYSEQSPQDGFLQLSSEILNLKTQFLFESNRAGKAESEVQSLKEILADAQAEKEAVSQQYEQSLKKLSSLEKELNEAQKNAGSLGERTSNAEIEIKILKEALTKLEAERDAALLKYNHCLERISTLESTISQAREDAEGLNERAYKAEIEAKNLKLEIFRLEADKEAVLLQYKHCLEIITVLENKISLAEETARMLNEKSERAESEVKALKDTLAKLKEEKDAVALLYDQCLDRIAKMESEFFLAQEEAKQLKSEIMEGAAKLRSVEEQRVLLEKSNEFLQREADHLVQKITVKDCELSEKQKELEKLQSVLQGEQSRFIHVETTLQTLQKLHSESQVEQQELTLELQNRLQMLKELEMCNQSLEENIQQVKGENQSLNELNHSSTTSIKNLQDEIYGLKEMKEKLEKEVSRQMDRSNALQQEVYKLKEEIEVLNSAYQALIEQLQTLGLNPECLASSVKELQNEIFKIKEECNRQKGEKEILSEKLKEMDSLSEKNAVLRSSVSELSGKLEGSRELVQELQKSCQSLQGDKSTLVSEKAALLSQLQIMTENMQKLMEKNTLLDNSLFGANVELEGLRAKSKNLEEFCQLLKNEKSNLLNERSSLISLLENVEERLSNLEKRFIRLEEKYLDMEKEKESTLSKVEELRGSLSLEQQERACYVQSSESRLAFLENHVNLLQEESRSRKREYEEELDKAVNAQVESFILQKFIKDLEEKNLSLLIECQKHVDTSKLSEKLIRELESENLEQQIEAEFLLDEIARLRVGIYQVYRSLQCDPVMGQQDLIEPVQILLPHILDNVENLRCSLARNKEENQQLLVENSVLLTFLAQLKLESTELESVRSDLRQDLMIMKEKNAVLQKEKHELLEMNQELMFEVSEGKLQEEVLSAELETQCKQLVNMQGSFLALQEQNSKQLEENRLLLKKFMDLKEEMDNLEEENIAALEEVVALSSRSLVFESFSAEKENEIKALSEELSSLDLFNSDLKEKVERLGEKLEKKEAENLQLNEIIANLQKELHAAKDLNHQLNYEIVLGKDFLKQKSMELLEAEQKLKAADNLNAEYCRALERLKTECEESKLIRKNLEEQILQQSKDSCEQKREIECLLEVNEDLGSEAGLLCRKLEDQRIREENLNLELQGKSTEVELWEVEAASFYFDFQASAICEVLLENKVHELTGVCKTLEDETVAKSAEIGQMKERVHFLESEVGGLKAQLSAYVPVIALLKENIASIEHNVHLQKRLFIAGNKTEKDGARTDEIHDMRSKELEEHESTVVTIGISDLQAVQSRLEAVEKALVEEMDKLAQQESNNNRMKLDSPTSEPVLKSRSASYKEDVKKEKMKVNDKVGGNLKSKKTKLEISEFRNGMLTKDIPLDQVSDCSPYGRRKRTNSRSNEQMLELWESAEQDSSINLTVDDMLKQAPVSAEKVPSRRHRYKDAEKKIIDPYSGLQVEKELGIDKVEVSTSNKQPRQGAKGRKVLERLASDGQKLTSLQTTVRELKKKVEMNKRSQKAYGLEYEEVKEQLQEVEEAIMELVNINDQLTKDVGESPSSLDGNSTELGEAGNSYRKRVIDQAQKGSEKIGRLQFEVQTIEYVLLKLEGERKSKKKTRFPMVKTGVLLRDFIYNGKHSRRRKKGCFCGCGRPSTSGD
ncbi:hypothetical protein SLE2022_257930 [Rubroshorea leprosula]